MAARTNPTGTTGPTTTQAGVLRPDEFARHVRLARLPVADALDPWVENYWTVRWDLPPGRSFVSATLPHPSHNLTVERGVARAGVEEAAVLVTGVVTRRFEVTAQGTAWTFGAKFRPGGLTALTGVEARALRDATVPARDLLAGHVVDALDELGPDVADQLCADRFDEVLKELATAPDPAYERVLEVVATMLADRGLLRVADVERRCGISERTLQRLFARYVGVSPKWVLARYRMHDAVGELDAGYAGSLADLAARYGWFDQAHFARDFSRLVGEPPSTYQRERLASRRGHERA